ncbi:PilZ domain-containing protein [Catenovulum maritimum]|uniref:PilZ domain-containing protein n=1 Tax=Catenovulum maritimum TaxID=1513271 RepID=A0A0J8H1I5_9ALTE|nr:PilZ domain-containing protein [Catenovulum maritimum]KMT66888.1 hypothetical protein XM47_01955 [Catenovulum maritimum]
MDFVENLDTLVKVLTPLRFDPAFNQIFSDKTQPLSNSEKFLLKMEVNRLCKPCRRSIDLRSYSKDCELFEFEGIKHYLPESAQSAFTQLTSAFNHQYTFYVYEQLLASYKIKPKQAEFDTKSQRSEVEKTLHSHVEFGQRVVRCEERMNYVTPVEIFADNLSLSGKTSDISITGIKVKLLGKSNLQKLQKIKVRFARWQEKFDRPQDCIAEYQVCWLDQTTHGDSLGLVIVEESKSELTEFIKKYIRSYKRKYRLDVSNTLHSVRNILFEQLYFYGCESIPLFLQYDGFDDLHIPYLLSQSANQTAISYWKDENNICQLRQLFKPSRVKEMLTQLTPVKHEYVFCFTFKQNGKKYFFSATQNELEDRQLLEQFWTYGAQNKGWRVFKIQLHQADISSAWRPVAIPDSAGSEIKTRNLPLNHKIKACVESCSHFALLIDVTNESAKNSYAKHKVDAKSLTELIAFKLDKLEDTQTRIIRYEALGKRREVRIAFKTNVKLTVNDIVCEAITVNISVHGLQLKLKTEVNIQEGQVLLLDLPDLNYGEIYGLKSLKYQAVIVKPEHKVLSLKAVGADNLGVKVFKNVLSKHNAEQQGLEKAIDGLELAFRNLFIYSTSQSCCFVSFNDKQTYCQLVESSTPTRLNALIERFKGHSQNSLEQILISHLRRLDSVSSNLKDELVLYCDKGSVKPIAWLSGLNSENIRLETIKPLLNTGAVWVIQFNAFQLSEADYKTVELELSYLSVYHPAAEVKLKQYLEGFNLAFTLVDITKEVLLRYRMNSEHIAANHQKQNEFVFDVID